MVNEKFAPAHFFHEVGQLRPLLLTSPSLRVDRRRSKIATLMPSGEERAGAKIREGGRWNE
ncbi:MAG TPA: hypothetical protein DCY86_15655 [Bdellovibrionales bacterium]|nr:hypothetical protein [Bdellovibrionales bacterium]